MTIEEFTEKDAEELENLFKIVWSKAFEYPANWRKKRQITKEKIKKEMHAGYHFFGARADGSIVGVYKLIVTDQGCFGEHQSILPGYAGKKVASAMYEQFINYAEVNNCKKCYVYVLESHDACRHLVEKFGFVKVDTFEQAPGMKVYKYERGIS